MKIADVRAKSADELNKELLDLRKEQLNLRIQKATGQLDNGSRVRAVRRDIARVKTVQAEINRGAVPAAKPAKAPKAAGKKAAAKKKES